MTAPLLSIIVLTYNTRDLLAQCLGCIYEQAISRGWQLVVVDNGSDDGTIAVVAEQYPAVEYLRAERNLGYAGGNNLGLRRSTGQAVLLLNSDVLASPDVLERLAHALLARPDVGAISAGLRTAQDLPQAYAYGAEPRPSYLLSRGLRTFLRLGAPHRWDVTEPISVEWVSGACLCVRREVLEQVGLLDERFFLYFEDTDWCLRMRKAGWRVIYDPRFPVVHLGGATRTQSGVSGDTYYDSLVAFYAKHYGSAAAAGVRLAIRIYRMLRGSA